MRLLSVHILLLSHLSFSCDGDLIYSPDVSEVDVIIELQLIIAVMLSYIYLYFNCLNYALKTKRRKQ